MDMENVMILDGDIREYIGAKTAFYSPDGLHSGAPPYVASYLKPQIVKSIKGLAHSTSSVLFAWSESRQDMGWVKRVEPPVIIGGKHAELLAFNGLLPNFENVNWWLSRLEGMEEPHIMPNYEIVLAERPTVGWLVVYSGDGCYWKKCTFCNNEYLPPYKEFNPQYVAKVVSSVNKYGKIALLSGNSHTVPWLEEMESNLPKGCWYDVAARADEKNWHHLKKVNSVFIGLEYLSDSVLKRINKGETVQQIMDTIIEIQALGINVESMVILDLWKHEDEREEHYQNTLKLIQATRRRHIEPKAGSFVLRETKYIPTSDCIFYVMDGKKITK